MSGLILALSLLGTVQAETVDFDREIRPIFAEHCAECHGGVKKKGGISVMNRAHMFAPAESGNTPITPGNAEESELIFRVATSDSNDRMPPKEPLAPEEIERLTKWIESGAEWPEHWAYLPIRDPEPVPVSRQEWIHNPIDQFVLARLENKGIAPSSVADPHTLIRRVSLDLTGLLPDPADVEAFAANPTQETYQKLVRKFLDSPAFGERWARHWLDEARYADSAGYEKDSPRMDAWRWREWVIQAINEDLPFDQFTLKQIAGDLLPGADSNDRLATYFHLNTQFNLEGGVDAEEDRTKRVIDRINTVATVWLGTTIGCAQCHDHPYDPISQREFYEFYAFFNNTDEVASLIGELPEDAARKIVEREKKWKPLSQMLDEQVTNKNLASKIQGQLTQMRKFDNDNGFTRTIGERRENRRETYVFRRGDFLQPLVDDGQVYPGTPAVLPELETRGEQADRIDLAHWLTSPEHPMVARVTVNKVWYHLFGEGLSSLLGDFGARGETPSHPLLLDWLAHYFVHEAGWSRKELIELIVTSQTYQQSSRARLDLKEIDPQNRLLAHQNRLRVEGEILRDISLQSAGLLSRKIGGPSVYPPLPSVIAEQSYANNFKYKTSSGEDRYRRGLYTFFKRTATDPNLILFDCPDASQASPRRNISNNALQALATLDNEVFSEAAVAKACEILDHGNDDAQAIEQAYLTALSRKPSTEEAAALTSLLTASREHFQADPEAAKSFVALHQPATKTAHPPEEVAAWGRKVALCAGIRPP